MTWTRLDDRWSDGLSLTSLSFVARWHYLTMIQWCSRHALYDGTIRAVDARRCSDVPDPDAALTELRSAELITATGSGYRLVHIDQHIPPPSVREASEKAKVRMQRMRLHRNGDHSVCLPEHCDQAVTAVVTRNTRTGTGQDGGTPGDPEFSCDGSLGAGSWSAETPSSVTASVTRVTRASRMSVGGLRCDRWGRMGGGVSRLATTTKRWEERHDRQDAEGHLLPERRPVHDEPHR